MDMQFYGANCVAFTYKGQRIVVDDNLADLGGKSVTKPDDVVLFTSAHGEANVNRLTLDGPGEYEVADVSVIGVTARSHIDEEKQKNSTIFKLVFGDINVVVAGHIHPDLSDAQQEALGIVDVLVVPVGGNGYTLDPIGALKVIKEIEPKLVIPTHYDDKALNFPVPQQELAIALKEIGMEPKETVSKLKLKPHELGDVTQLIVLEKS